MDSFLNIIGKFFQGLFVVLQSLCTGIVKLTSEHPKIFATVVLVILFLLALKYLPGFGELVAQIIALLLILWVMKVLFLPKKRNK